MPVETAKDIEVKAQQALASCPVYALRELLVECDGAALAISGRVTSYYHKQLAQEIVRHAVEHVDVEVEVINEIDVQQLPPR